MRHPVRVRAEYQITPLEFWGTGIAGAPRRNKQQSVLRAKVSLVKNRKPFRGLLRLCGLPCYRGQMGKTHKNQKQTQKATRRPTTSLLQGTISVTGKGVGYVEHEAFDEDIEIPAGSLNTALDGDDVSVVLLPRVRGERQQGQVQEVTKRARTDFVGVVEKDEGGSYIVPDSRKMYVDIAVREKEAEGLQSGQKVLVRITVWKDPKKNPLGTILKVLGKKGDHEVEMEAIILEKGFVLGFPHDVEEEAMALKDSANIDDGERGLRRDMRSFPTFTIDPLDAKDFDDAISMRERGGDFEVGVHIADVSHYVRPGMKLDREAAARGTSVYLVDRTIPMLPEVLSNELCSLNPHEDKLTFSAVFVLSEDGTVLDRWFGKTLIRSKRRFSYEDAQRVLNDGAGDFCKELAILNALAKKIKARRHKDGAIEFEEDEVRFELDAKGAPVGVHRKERLDTHKLVEEFMLLANREVAECINRMEKHEKKRKPFIYRVHDVPNPEKIEGLALFLKAIGYELAVKNGRVSSQDLNALFRQLEGEAAEGLVKTAAIRAMAKAIYTTANIGHFGLAFEYYTHFTSPIRRYPDIMVHRLLEYYLAGNKPPESELERYHALATTSSRREIEATEAERASIKYKQVEYMQKHVGETFDAIISGVTQWGVYVEERDTKAEGMIRTRDLSDDFYELDEKKYALIGTRTKKKLSLGDSVRVKLTRADLDARTLDFVLVK